jgi:hypothetical protein
MKYKVIISLIFLIPLMMCMYFLNQTLNVHTLHEYIVIKCPLKLLTSITCPTCGLGRSIIYTFSGHWSLAMKYHPLGIFFSLSPVLFFFYKIETSKTKKLKLLFNNFYFKKFTYLILALYIGWGFLLRDTSHL